MDQNLKTDAVTLTKTLCAHLAGARFGDLSAAAKREARRGVLDWIGCALAGSGHRTITTLLGVLQETSGKPAATVLGRKLEIGPARRTARQRTDGPRAGLRRHPHGRRGASYEFAGAGRAVRAGRTGARQRRAVHAGLCDRLRGRRALGPHCARSPQGRLASHRHARLDRCGRRGRQAPRSRRAAADLRDGDCRDPGRRHAAEPRHHVQVAARRQGRGERRIGRAARRARL